MKDCLDGRPELVETGSHGFRLGVTSVSGGILDFGVEAKHGRESQRRCRKELGVKRDGRSKGLNDENWQAYELLIVPILGRRLDSNFCTSGGGWHRR